MKKYKIVLLVSLSLLCSSFVAAKSLKVAVSAYKIVGGKSLEFVLSSIHSQAIKAKQNSADILLLPELVTLDIFPTNPSDTLSQISHLVSKEAQFRIGLQKIAKQVQLTIVGASTFTNSKAGWINRSYLLEPSGKVRFQDKLYPTPWERSHQIQLTHKLKVFEIQGVKIVHLICHDVEFPNISQELAKIKPDVLLVSAQTDSQKGLNRVLRTSQARAIEHFAYVIVSATTGNEGASWHRYVGGAFKYSPQTIDFNDEEFSYIQDDRQKIFHLKIDELKSVRSKSTTVHPCRDLLISNIIEVESSI